MWRISEWEDLAYEDLLDSTDRIGLAYEEITAEVIDREVPAVSYQVVPAQGEALDVTILPLAGVDPAFPILLTCYRRGAPLERRRCLEFVTAFAEVYAGHNSWPEQIPTLSQYDSGVIIDFVGRQARLPGPCGLMDITSYQCRLGQVSWTVHPDEETARRFGGRQADRALGRATSGAPSLSYDLEAFPCDLEGVATTCRRVSMAIPERGTLIAYFAEATVRGTPVAFACSRYRDGSTDDLGPVCEQFLRIRTQGPS